MLIGREVIKFGRLNSKFLNTCKTNRDILNVYYRVQLITNFV